FRGSVTNFNRPIVSGSYDLSLGTEDLASFATRIPPTGKVTLSGKVRYQGERGHSFLRDVAIDGQVLSPALSVTASEGRIAVRNFKGQYQLADGTLHLNGISTDTLGGRIKATADIKHVDSRAMAQVTASLQGIALSEVERSVNQANLKGVSVVASIDGNVRAS